MAGYLGASPVPQTIQKKQSFTATASQTTFTTTGYTDGAFINVYLNGVRLINGTDYTATNGSDIVLTTGASASDVLDFETFNEFTLVDQTLETPTFRTSATLKNDTHEDTDGGRESTLIFKGEQSGGEISTLAQIQASHDGTSDDQKGDLIFKTNDGSDNDAPTERARIDSSGNLSVGTTELLPADNSTEGMTYKNGLSLQVFRDAGAPVVFGRGSSDGSVAVFSKDGTTVGSIVTGGGDLAIGTGTTSGMRFNDALSNVLPYNVGGVAYSDNAIDLGYSTVRWKDLYLSGGAYIGGTGASNKLDDYEEGTFTPSFVASGSESGQAYQSQVGTYVKIGRMVHAKFHIQLTSEGTFTGTYLLVAGLPFTIASSPAPVHANNCYFVSLGVSVYSVGLQLFENDTKMYLWAVKSAGVSRQYLANSDLSNATELSASIVYQTS